MLAALSEWLKIKLITYFFQPLLRFRRIPLRWKPIGACRHCRVEAGGKEAFFQCDGAAITLKSLGPQIMGIQICWDGEGSGDFSWSVVSKREDAIRIDPQEEHRLVVTGKVGLKAILDRRKSAFEFRYKNLILRTESVSAGRSGSWICSQWRSPEPELYVGFGQKTKGLFKNKHRLVMWNTDNSDIGPRSEPLYQSCPLQIAIRRDGTAHAVYFDNPHYSRFQVGDGRVGSSSLYVCEGGPLRYYILAGPTLELVLSQFTELTGRYPLPPRWALGYHHSRWVNEESAARILELAAEFRNRDIPCDVLYLDIGHMEGFRPFTWNKERFPDPSGFTRELHSQGFKLVAIADPGIKRDEKYNIYRQGRDGEYFCRTRGDRIYHGPVWAGTSAFPDFTSADVRRWWGKLYSAYPDIDGFWIDMNEPSLFTPRRTIPDSVRHSSDDAKDSLSHGDVHNVYGFLMARASFEGLCFLRPGKRQFLLTRSAFSGIQRYASSWTGDNKSNWTHLRMSIPMLLNMGLSGQVLVGPDIGGFWGKPSKELMMRWIQLGSFYPFCRNHNSLHAPAQEPWSFDREVEETTRRYLNLRYELLPYLYTCLREGCRWGKPMMRPLFLDFPSDRECLDPDVAESEYLVGPHILIAPLLRRGMTERMVYLPGSGFWIDWWSGERYSGGRRYTVKAAMDTLPLFVREGSALPTGPHILHTGQAKSFVLTLLLYSDGNVRGTVYIDDGYSLGYRQDHFSLLEISGTRAGRREDVTIKRKEGDLSPILGEYSKLAVRFFRKHRPIGIREVLLNGREALWRLDGDWLEVSDIEAVFPITISLLEDSP